jgi:precorrin-2 methylase
MSNAVVMQLQAKEDDEAPYLAVVLVPGWEARQ